MVKEWLLDMTPQIKSALDQRALQDMVACLTISSNLWFTKNNLKDLLVLDSLDLLHPANTLVHNCLYQAFTSKEPSRKTFSQCLLTPQANQKFNLVVSTQQNMLEPQ